MYRHLKASKHGMLKSVCLLLTVLLCAVEASAQLEIGDNIKANLSGSIGYGYSGSFDNQGASSHGQGLSGNGNLTGYYYHPNFVSFDVRPYYDRSQSNSETQNVSRGTGIGSSLGIFGGSHFPGAITFSKDFSRDSQFQFAGIPSVVGNSSGRSFGVSWGAFVPKLPTLSASFTSGSTASSLEGTTADTESTSKSFTLNSSYSLVGFNLQGFLSRYKSHFDSTGVLTPDRLSSGGTSTTYGVTAQHVLPLRGGLSLGWGHSTNESESGSSYSSDSYTAGINVAPWKRLSLSESINYTTNFTAAFSESILGVGSPLLRSDTDSNSLYLLTTANLNVGHGMNLNGSLTHREQTTGGERFTDTQFGGSVVFNHSSPLFGFLNFGIGVVDTATQRGNDGLGITGSLSASRRFGTWDTAADFNYAQNVQTMVVFATTSSYSYGGNVRRRINRDTFWNASVRASHSGLTARAGSSNRSESYSSGFSRRNYGMGASYSQSSGTAVFTSSGTLSSNPLDSLVTEDFTLFNARSFGVNGSVQLLRRISLSGGYSRFTSTTTERLSSAANNGDRYSVRMDYRLRKFTILTNYGRTMQVVSAIPGGPRVANSFSVSLSRWFNVF